MIDCFIDIDNKRKETKGTIRKFVRRVILCSQGMVKKTELQNIERFQASACDKIPG
jgi:hypothetical protein